MGSLNRRALFGASAAAIASVSLPAIALARQPSRLEQIEVHKTALLELLREEFPETVTRLTVAIGMDLEGGRSYVIANGLRKEWQENPRLTGGGLWVERSLGDWTPSRGLVDWSAC